MDLLTRIDTWGHREPDRVAQVSGDRRLTYGELTRGANALAAYLAAALPDDSSPVAVLGHKEPEVLIAYLGCVKSGHPYVPLDSASPPLRIEGIVAASGARLTLTPENVATWSANPAPAPSRRPKPTDPHYIMFTSGSTGEPKGVVITRACLVSFLTWTLDEQAPVEGKEVFLDQVVHSFDVSVMDLYVSLLTGGCLFSLTHDEIANPRRLYRSLAASEVTVWVSTPTFAQLCLADRTFDRGMLPRVRKFLFCGETLAPEIATQLLDRFPGAEVWNTYGPTEATVATTSVRIDRDIIARYSPLPIGYPMPGSRILLLDEEQEPAAPGERGQIVIAGPNVSPGYLGRPDLTERSFFSWDGQRAYRTGDWGRVRDGLLFFEGRMDSQIKLHGYRVELGDVEANLLALPNVSGAVVLPILKNDRVDSLTAYVALARRPDGSDFEVSRNLVAQLATRLPIYMVPRHIRFVESFPMTPNGKVDRRKLAEMAG